MIAMFIHQASNQPTTKEKLSLIQTEVSIPSPNGLLKAILTENPSVSSHDAVILCPGLAVGMEGDFVVNMEKQVIKAGLARWSLRFNFFGLTDNNFNQDIGKFTFSTAMEDFSSAVSTLRNSGAGRVIALCSSTGTQIALLASCNKSAAQFADDIIGRSAVVDCFAARLSEIPARMLGEWKEQGSFEMPVGGNMVRMSSDFIWDIEFWKEHYNIAQLKSRLRLIHGKEDQVVTIESVLECLSAAPAGLVRINIIDKSGHDLSDILYDGGVRYMIDDLKVILR